MTILNKPRVKRGVFFAIAIVLVAKEGKQLVELSRSSSFRQPQYVLDLALSAGVSSTSGAEAEAEAAAAAEQTASSSFWNVDDGDGDDDGEWWVIKPPQTNETRKLPSTLLHPNTTANSTNFTRHEGVVFVTKVLGFNQHDVENLKQWVCLIQHAYNDKMKYDYIIFTTLPWHPNQVKALQDIAYPSNLTVALEGPPLEKQLAAMTQLEKEFLFDRCNKTATANLTYFHHCREPGYKGIANLGYAWQAEFRSYWIWTHPALRPYKYMVWIDADASVTTEWKVDPLQVMVDKNLTILYAGWPYGNSGGGEHVQQKFLQHYGVSICQVQNVATGEDHPQQLDAKVARDCAPRISQVAGNHHITNLDVYRKSIHQQFLKNYTQDYRFGRKNDDQASVTIIGLMEQYLANQRLHTTNNSTHQKVYKVGHETTLGVPLRIVHHCMYDANRRDRTICMRWKQYDQELKQKWPGLEERCPSKLMRKVPNSPKSAMEA